MSYSWDQAGHQGQLGVATVFQRYDSLVYYIIVCVLVCHCVLVTANNVIRWIITMFLATTSAAQNGCIIIATYISSSYYILSMY